MEEIKGRIEAVRDQIFGEGLPETPPWLKNLDRLGISINRNLAVKQQLEEGISIDEKLSDVSPKLRGFFSGKEGSRFQISVVGTVRAGGVTLRLNEIGWGWLEVGNFLGGIKPEIHFFTDPANPDKIRVMEENWSRLKELESQPETEQIELIREATLFTYWAMHKSEKDAGGAGGGGGKA